MDEFANNNYYPKNVIVISQFEEQIKTQRIITYMKKWQNDNASSKDY